MKRSFLNNDIIFLIGNINIIVSINRRMNQNKCQTSSSSSSAYGFPIPLSFESISKNGKGGTSSNTTLYETT